MARDLEFVCPRADFLVDAPSVWTGAAGVIARADRNLPLSRQSLDKHPRLLD